ncbi:TetR/AcrR family transcriptional regulator [Leptospira sp. WS92.C1]
MPKIVDPDIYRISILKRCPGLFIQKGYAVVTMREISKELRVSTGTLYHYFPNKEVLFEEMARWMVNEDAKQLAEIREINHDKSTEEKLELLFEFVREREDHFRDLILLACDLYRQKGEPDRAILKECSLILRDAIENHLGFEDQEMETLFFSLLIGTIFQRMLNQEAVDFEKIFAMIRGFTPLLTNNLFLKLKKIGNDLI